MLGWQISIHRQTPGQTPDAATATKELLLATWTAGIGGLDWLDELVREGKAVNLGGDGYPCRYTASAGSILPRISSGPPRHKGPLVIGDDYVLPGGWAGEIKIDHARIAQCRADEQLIIEAWDQS